MKIDFRKALSNPINDRLWLVKVLVGGLLITIPTGHIIVYGYLILYLSSLLNSDDQHLPSWTEIRKILGISLKVFAVTIVYFLPLVGMTFILKPYIGFDLNLNKKYLIFSTPIILLILFYLDGAYVRFVQHNFQISAALNIKEVFNLLRANIKDYTIVFLFDAVLFISGLMLWGLFFKTDWMSIMIQFFVGTFCFYMRLSIYNMLAMVFKKGE